MTNMRGVIQTIQGHVVRVITPRGSGTGFFFYRSKDSSLICVATAAHVIDQAHYWEEPIRIQSAESLNTVLLHKTERAVFIDEARDTAAIMFSAKGLQFPDRPVEMVDGARYLRVGTEIGWLGFPAVASTQLCYFGGRISAWQSETDSYLVDGVAINGVSGGPAFYCKENGDFKILGSLSAYIPNRATGETLPGLAVISDVTHYQSLVQKFNSINEAKEEEPTATAPPPPSPAELTEPTGPTKRRSGSQ